MKREDHRFTVSRAARQFRLVVAFVLLPIVAACGGSGADGGSDAETNDPLVGIWTTHVTFEGQMHVLSVTYDANGSASEDLTIVGCTGQVIYAHGTWTSAASTITVTSGKCSGSVVCPVGNGSKAEDDCSGGRSSTGTCHYALSSGNDTLTLTRCSANPGAAPVVYSRSR